MYRSLQVVGLVLAVLAIGGSRAFAQGIFFADSQGTMIPLSQKSLGRFAASPTPSKILTAGNLQWRVTYQDVAQNRNLGFDDPTAGATRQAAAEAVMDYIGQVLHLSSSSSVDVTFEVSQMDGTGYLAAAGTLWLDSPDRFDNGFAFQHITTGTDPDAETTDIICTVDFGFSWNANHTTPPAPGQTDLFSVLLHEMTHGLGMLSLSDSQGRDHTHQNPGVYTQWDRLMRYNVETACWNSTTTVRQVAPSAFTSDNLFFGGANARSVYGSRPPIYAPHTFTSGSSLGHFKTGVVNSVMQHAIAPGVTKRTYTLVDIAALRDIGYTNAAPPVVVAPVANFTASPVSGDAPLTVTFTDSSTNYPDIWAWDFDNDGHTDSTSQNPSHTYTTPGTYTVKLTVTNSAGSDVEIKTGYITANLKTSVEVSGGTLLVEGDRVTLTATPAGALGYQWYRNGQLISGATGQTLVFQSATSGNSGTYTCEINTSTDGVVTTAPVVVVIHPAADLPLGGKVALSALALALIALATTLTLRGRRPAVN